MHGRRWDASYPLWLPCLEHRERLDYNTKGCMWSREGQVCIGQCPSLDVGQEGAALYWSVSLVVCGAALYWSVSLVVCGAGRGSSVLVSVPCMWGRKGQLYNGKCPLLCVGQEGAALYWSVSPYCMWGRKGQLCIGQCPLIVRGAGRGSSVLVSVPCMWGRKGQLYTGQCPLLYAG